MTTTNKPIALTVCSDQGLLEWARGALAESGLQILPARNAVSSLRLIEALRGFTGRAPDLVLLGEPIEETNLMVFCRRLRGLEGMTSTPILFLVEHEGPEAEAQARAAGGSGMLTKPVSPADLRIAIRKVLVAGTGATRDQAHVASFLAFKRALVESTPPAAEVMDRVEALACRDLYALGPLLGVSAADIARRLASYLGLPHLSRVLPDTIDWTVLSYEFCGENAVLPVWSADRTPIFVVANPFLGGLLDALDHTIWGDRSPGLAIAEPGMILESVREYRGVPRPTAPRGAAGPSVSAGMEGTRRSITRLIHRRAIAPEWKEATLCFGRTPEKAGAPVPPLPRAQEPPVPVVTPVHDKAPDVPLVPDPPAVAMADGLLREAVRLEASDIHIEPKNQECLIRFRIDGEMQSMRSVPPALAGMLISRLKALGGLDIAERRRPQDGVVQVEIEKRHFRLRLATTSTPSGESLILRLLEPTAKPRPLSVLGMTETQAKTMMDLASRNQGLILIVGTTGSGKSTTIHSVLSTIDGHTRSILSVEDPIEYVIPWANQQQVIDKAGVSFESLLKSTMRQDPDVLFVGEIRDFASAKASIDFASSGHLTITTLHSANATTAIFRLERLGIQRGALAEALLAVIAQKLLRVLCPRCKRMEPITAEEAARLAPFKRTLPTRVGRAVGCEACRGTGYRGRTGVYEILPFDNEILDMVRLGAPVPQIRAIERQRGYYLISDHAVDKVRDGIVSLADAYEHVLVEEVDLMPKRKKTEVLPAPSPLESPAGRASVLVVDDDADLLALVERMFEGSGHDVVLARDSVEALIHLARRRFDLMLLDIGLPDMDGFHLLDALEQKGIDTTVHLMTAMSDEELARKAAGYGTFDVLRKPFAKEELLERVERSIQARRPEVQPA